MRLNENGIKYRNEVQLFNTRELLIWLFGSDYLKGYRFKVDGIKIMYYDDYQKLNKIQLDKVKIFINKYKDILPSGLIKQSYREIGKLNEENKNE